MKQITDSLQQCLNQENYTAALMVGLSIPDICGKLENKSSSPKRYIEWHDKYMKPEYGQFLSGNDCYALRCAILHEGSIDISRHSIRRILDKFYLTANGKAHLTRCSNCIVGDLNYDNKEFLQISVQKFCEDIIEAVKAWENDMENLREVQENILAMFCIHEKESNLGTIHFK